MLLLLRRLVSTTHLNPKAMPTNYNDYSCWFKQSHWVHITTSYILMASRVETHNKS